MRPPTSWLPAAAVALLAACVGPSYQAVGEPYALRSVHDDVNQDSLQDGRLAFSRPGWQVGSLPPEVTDWDATCPSPLGMWVIQHAYRASPSSRAELKVLAYPWLSPEELRAARTATWKEKKTRATPLPVRPPLADSRDDWELATAKGTWRVAHVQRSWPDGGGTWVIAACAPTAGWAEAEGALAAAVAGLEPVARTGLEAAGERAGDFRRAAETWRFVLPPGAVSTRVKATREAVLGALRNAPGFEGSAEANWDAALVLALDGRGVQFGPGWDAAGALAFVLKARALDPSGKAIIGADRVEGVARLALGEPARALSLLEPVVALGEPRGLTPPELYAEVGEARAALGRADKAEEAFKRARAALTRSRSFPKDPGPAGAESRRREEEMDARLRARGY